MKEESRDQSRGRWLFLHVSFYFRGDEDTEFQVPCWPPWAEGQSQADFLPCLQNYIPLLVFHNVLDANTRQSLLAKWLTLQIA